MMTKKDQAKHDILTAFNLLESSFETLECKKFIKYSEKRMFSGKGFKLKFKKTK